MVLAPFFFAFGAFGGGLFVASPCVMGVVCVPRRWSARAVCGYVRRRAAALRAAAACRGGGVCVCAGANGAAVCGNVRRRGVFVCQRAGGLRRRAPCVLRAARRRAAAFRSVFWPSERRPKYAQRRRAAPS